MYSYSYSTSFRRRGPSPPPSTMSSARSCRSSMFCRATARPSSRPPSASSWKRKHPAQFLLAAHGGFHPPTRRTARDDLRARQRSPPPRRRTFWPATSPGRKAPGGGRPHRKRHPGEPVLPAGGLRRAGQRGVVVEADREHYAFQAPYVLLPDMASHPITDSLIEENYFPIMPISQGLTVQGSSGTATVTQLLTTSSSAFSKLAGYSPPPMKRKRGISTALRPRGSGGNRRGR